MKRFLFIIILPLLLVSARAQMTMAPLFEPESQDYFARIVGAGSDISLLHKVAIDRFVKSAKANNYWSFLIEVGPLAGTNLAAAMVKLKYAGQPPFSFIAGSTYISSTLTNVGMVESNYVAGVGIYGTASRYFRSGVNFTNFASSAGGVSFFLNNDMLSPATSFMIGTEINNVDAFLEITSGALRSQFGGGGALVNALSQTTWGGGFYHSLRTSATAHRFMVNGIQCQAIATDITTNINRNIAFTVFAGGTTFATTNIGSFYAIDNGGFTTNSAALFSKDVNNLVLEMGRRPLIPWRQPYVPSYGQSLSVGVSSGTALTTTSTNTYTKMPTRGPIGLAGVFVQSSFAPLTEIAIETHCASFGNTVAARSSTDGFGRTNDVTAASYGVSGLAYSSLAKGTAPYQNLTNRVREGRDISPYYYSGGFYVPGVVVIHGESDFNNTSYSNNVVTWQSDIQSDFQSITGQTNIVPLFHSQASSWTAYTATGSRTTSDSPYQVLSAYKVHPTTTVLVMPKYFLTGYAADGVHLTNSNYRWVGEYYAKAYYTNIVLGGVFQPLYPTNVSRSSAVITLTFPTGVDLALDTTAVTTNANWGFEFFDDAGPSATISSVAFSGTSPTNTVQVTLSGTPTGGNKRIRYAYTGTSTAKGGATTGPRGNLKRPDSSWTSLYGNNLDDWCVHFDEVCP